MSHPACTKGFGKYIQRERERERERREKRKKSTRLSYLSIFVYTYIYIYGERERAGGKKNVKKRQGRQKRGGNGRGEIKK